MNSVNSLHSADYLNSVNSLHSVHGVNSVKSLNSVHGVHGVGLASSYVFIARAMPVALLACDT